METMIMMSVYLTMFMLMFVVLLIAIACFCYIVRRISRNKEISPKLEKWIYVLDWTKEDKDD